MRCVPAALQQRRRCKALVLTRFRVVNNERKRICTNNKQMRQIERIAKQLQHKNRNAYQPHTQILPSITAAQPELTFSFIANSVSQLSQLLLPSRPATSYRPRFCWCCKIRREPRACRRDLCTSVVCDPVRLGSFVRFQVVVSNRKQSGVGAGPR